VRLIDGSTFRIPRIGVYTVSGINMDREGVKPDHEVIAHPDQLARGVDAQLDRAVEVLQVEVAEWKKKKASVPTGTPLTPTAPVPSPMPMAP
jgi:tricorn protease